MPELPILPPIADQPLSVVLLARNCADCVSESIRAWLTFLDSSRRLSYELILVDDGSDDGTGDRAQAHASAYPALRVIRHGQHRGEGAALRSGLEAATKPLVFYTLCHPDYRPEQLARLLDRTIDLEEGGQSKEIDRVHLMSGFRAGVKMPIGLRVAGWLWRALSFVLFSYAPRPSPGWLGMRRQFGGLLARILFGLRHHDVSCPFRLMRREILARIPLQSKGPFAHVELVAKANFLGVGGLMSEHEEPLEVKPPPYRGDARSFFSDGQKVFNKPDFGPAVLP
jgi:glycosyltransferase involved in cell wall biosynthesis